MRLLALYLLHDDNGINAEAWEQLRPMLEANGDSDIIAAVKAQDDRYFLESEIAEALIFKAKRPLFQYHPSCY